MNWFTALFKRITRALLLAISVIGVSIDAKTVIWDLGGVLFDTDRKAIAKEVGYMHFVSYALFTWHNPLRLKGKVFDALELVGGVQHGETDCDCCMGDGIELPEIFCAWLRGEIAGTDIIKTFESAVSNGTCDTILTSRRERDIVCKLINTMFDAKISARNTHPIKRGVEVLEKCAKNEGNTLMILSNYAQDSFEALYNKDESAEVFDWINPDKMVVSGFIGKIKPYNSIYIYLKEVYHLDPHECIIVDDQEENIKAAQRHGFTTIWLKDGNYDDLERDLRALGVICDDK